MNRNPKKRLGAGREGTENVKKHPWFKNIDWKAVRERKLEVPKPKPRPIIDERMSPNILRDKNKISKISYKVKGWEYMNRSAM